VELADPTHGSKYREIFSALKSRLSKSRFSKAGLCENHFDETGTSFKSIVDSVSKLGSSLGLTESVHHDRDRATPKAPVSKSRTVWDVLVEQDAFISGVLDIQQRCRESRGKKDAKESELKSMLMKEGYDRKCHLSPVPLPSTPDIFVSGVNPETAKMFKSALYPALLEFHVEATIRPDSDNVVSSKRESAKLHHVNHEQKVTTYKVMVKTGDDLRQDQLVIMMIQLMDGLLKRAALDLCLTPYSIIATSHNSGLVEFVEGAMPIAQVLYKYNNSILQFFQTMSPQVGAKYDVRPEVISTYLRSCAGYCVITYLLGVGDRHLDNILLRATGHFFHIGK
jgi:phosphatidylinositol 3-kinase